MRHGFAISIQPFAHEHEPDEDSLFDREPRYASDEPDAKQLDLHIKRCAAELAYLRALKSGDKGLAEKHRKEAERADRALSKLGRGHDDKGDDEDGEQS